MRRVKGSLARRPGYPGWLTSRAYACIARLQTAHFTRVDTSSGHEGLVPLVGEKKTSLCIISELPACSIALAV